MNNCLKIKIISIVVMILGFAFVTTFWGSTESTVNDTFKRMRDEVLKTYREKGEPGVRQFIKANNKVIDRKFLIDFADTCFKEGIGWWQTISKTILNERQDLLTVPKWPQDNKSKGLLKALVSIYKAKGEKGVKAFAKANKNKLDANFITRFLSIGLQERKEEWKSISLILAKEKKDTQILRAVYLIIGNWNQKSREAQNSILYKEKELVQKILTVYKEQGKSGMQQFVRENEKKINYPLINAFVNFPGEQLADEWLDMARIMAKETKNEKALAEIYYAIGIYLFVDKVNSDDMIMRNEELESEETHRLIRQIDDVYKSKGEKGLRRFVRDNSQKIDLHFILYLIDDGQKALQDEKADKKPRQKKKKKKKSFFKKMTRKLTKVFVPKVDKIIDTIDKTKKTITQLQKTAKMVKNIINDPEAFVQKYKQDYIEQFNQFMELYAEALRKGMLQWMRMAVIVADEIKNEDALAYAYYVMGSINNQYGALSSQPPKQEIQPKDEETIKLGMDIIAIYEQQKEAGLRRFVKDNNAKINRQFINSFMQFCIKEKKKEWQRIALTIAEEKKDDDMIADVNFKGAQLQLTEYGQTLMLKMDLKVEKENIDTLKNKLLTVYKEKGEIGLKEFVKKRLLVLNHDVIVELAKLGAREKKEEWLDIVRMIYDQKHKPKENKFKELPEFDNSLYLEGTRIVKTDRFKLILNEMALKHEKRAKKKFHQWIEQSRNRIRSGNTESVNQYNLRVEQLKAEIDAFRLMLMGSMSQTGKPGKITRMKKHKDRHASMMYNNLFELIGQLPPTQVSREFIANFYQQFQETVLLSLQNKFYDAGFDNAERIRARRFLTQLGDDLYKRGDEENKEIKTKREDYISQLSALGKKIYLADEEDNGGSLETLKQQYTNLLIEFEFFKFDNRPRKKSLGLFNTYSISPEVLNLDKLRKTLDNEIVLYYFIANNQVHVFVISSMFTHVVSLEASENEINRTINRYLLHVKSNHTANVTRYGNKLYQMLFQPLKKSLMGKVNLLIVPDGNLALIPFESFVIHNDAPGNPVYLLERYRIKYIQSASALSMVRKTNSLFDAKAPLARGYHHKEYYTDEEKKSAHKKLKKKKRKKRIQDRFIGFGDPSYGNKGNLNRLKASGEEVEAIAELFKNKYYPVPAVYVREKANEEIAKSSNLNAYDYIHFSCHGILKDNFQSLVLSQNQDPGEDGYLTLMEIGHCDYKAKLVVLSACETGTGEVEKGEGVTGLTRAVMIAGTPAVVASLWSVDDIATKELMVKFYKNILEKGMSNQKALRSAKLEMINSEKYSSPYFWSAFVMYGE